MTEKGKERLLQQVKRKRKVHKVAAAAPPILSMTEPRTRPAHVSNTRTLLRACTFARVSIWASVS